MIYDDGDLHVTLSSVNIDFSHTCGNVTSVIHNDFKSKFPKKYFKGSNINTRIALKQFQDKNEAIKLKIEKPFFSMQPRLILDKTEFTINVMNRMYSTSLFDLSRPDYTSVKFFKDIKKGIAIDFAVDRAKLEFEFNILLSSEYQQLNIAKFIQSTVFRLNEPYYKTITLETLIPDCIIEQLSKESGIPIKDKNNSIIPFLSYLNTISNIPIVYGRQTSTSLNRFFMVITTNLLMEYKDIDISSNNEGQASDKFIIQLHLSTEFNYPTTFYYLSHNEGRVNDSSGIDFINSEDVVLHYTTNRTLIPEYDSFDYILFITCVCDVDTDILEDRTSIKELFIDKNREIIEKLKKENKSINNNFVHIYLYENGRIMEKNKEFKIDWDNEEIIIFKPKKHKTYRTAIYLNQKLINNSILKNHEYNLK